MRHTLLAAPNGGDKIAQAPQSRGFSTSPASLAGHKVFWLSFRSGQSGFVGSSKNLVTTNNTLRGLTPAANMQDEQEPYEITCPIGDDDDELTADELKKNLLQTEGRLRISAVLDSVGFTNDPSDIAIDLGDALYLGEEIAKLFSVVGFSQFKRSIKTYIGFDFQVDCASLRLDQLAQTINSFSFYEFPDDRGEGYLDFHESLFDQDENLTLKFPEIAEDYMANLLHGSWHWEDEGSLEKYQKRFPESAYYFWQSFVARQKGLKVYCSADAWVVPNKINIKEYFDCIGYSASDRLELARIVNFEGLKSILISDSNARRIPMRQLNIAKNFSSGIGLKKDKKFLGEEWGISLSGQIAIYKNRFATHVFFAAAEPLSERERLEYADHTEKNSRKIKRSLGLDISIRCEWQRMDDNEFEELCYDVICRSGKFDSRTVRKLGNSRSRDGGRDIVAVTYPLPGEPPKKWIIQCKFSLKSKSISGSKVEISDVIDQFHAEGFCVMTNVIIDATLFDKLSAIALRRGIGHDAWSGMELERFLQLHPDLIQRYFNKR